MNTSAMSAQISREVHEKLRAEILALKNEKIRLFRENMELRRKLKCLKLLLLE